MLKRSIKKEYIWLFVIGLLLLTIVNLKVYFEYESALTKYRQEAGAEAIKEIQKLQYRFTQLYQNLRIISLLPSVRNIDSQGKNFTPDSLESIQQIYQNLDNNIHVSKIYIAPLNIDPDKILPETGTPQGPIKIFNQSFTRDNYFLQEDEGDHTAEYRAIKKQIAFIKSRYAQMPMNHLSVPLISGEEVMTSDNSEYKTTHEDSDRLGLLFSVPFYDSSEKLKGAIVAVIRNNSLKNLIPNYDFTLINPTYGYINAFRKSGQFLASLQWIKEGKPDPNLLYSEIIPLITPDPASHWAGWFGLSNEYFYSSNAYIGIKTFFYTANSIVIILLFIMLSLIRASHQLKDKIAGKS